MQKSPKKVCISQQTFCLGKAVTSDPSIRTGLPDTENQREMPVRIQIHIPSESFSQPKTTGEA